jgi:hypothetical protein
MNSTDTSTVQLRTAQGMVQWVYLIEVTRSQVGVQVELTWWVLGSNFSLKGLLAE